jgi:hypothetical protein
MPSRLRVAKLAALLLAFGGMATAFAAPPTTFAATTICDQYGTTTVGNYTVMNNRWGTSATQCISVTNSGFSIIQQDGTGNLSGAPTAYPAIYIGCHYGNCSPSSPLPAQISSISSANTSVTLTYPASGTYDAAYDIWLNADTNVTGVQDTEIMIWLNHTGSIQPIGSNTGKSISVGGRNWAVWVGNNGQNNVVSYVQAGITSFSVDAMAFIRDAITRGSGFGTTAWYLTSMQMGFEPWIGGVGLTVNTFSATINKGGNQTPTPVPTASPTPRASSSVPPVTPSPIRTSSPTPGGSARCSAVIVENAWSNGFTATVTVSNTGTIATRSWKVSWTWPGNQSIVNGWNATIATSGSAVTAASMGYNGAISAGGNTTFGFQAGFGGTNALPTLTCSAG